MIDLRSDTMTLPSPGMRAAMAAAALGDDGYREDPSVNQLEEMSADRLGTEAALFVSSGTMGNLIGMLVNARSGDEIIAERHSHVMVSEVAGAAMVGGIQLVPIPTSNGIFSASEVRDVTRPPGSNYPRSAAVVIETTHNRHGGVAWSLAELREVSTAAHEAGMLRAHRRRSRLQRRARDRRDGARDRGERRHDHLLPLQGTWLSGRQRVLWDTRCGRPSAALAQDARRRDTSGRSARRGRRLRARQYGRPARRGPRDARERWPRGLPSCPGSASISTRVHSNIVAFDVELMSVPAISRGLRERGCEGRLAGRVTRSPRHALRDRRGRHPIRACGSSRASSRASDASAQARSPLISPRRLPPSRRLGSSARRCARG